MKSRTDSTISESDVANQDKRFRRSLDLETVQIHCIIVPWREWQCSSLAGVGRLWPFRQLWLICWGRVTVLASWCLHSPAFFAAMSLSHLVSHSATTAGKLALQLHPTRLWLFGFGLQLPSVLTFGHVGWGRRPAASGMLQLPYTLLDHVLPFHILI